MDCVHLKSSMAVPLRIFDFAKKYLPSVTSGVLSHQQKVVLVIVERAQRIPIVTARQNYQLTSYAFEVPSKRVDRTSDRIQDSVASTTGKLSRSCILCMSLHLSIISTHSLPFFAPAQRPCADDCLGLLFLWGAVSPGALRLPVHLPMALWARLPSENGRDRWDPVECTGARISYRRLHKRAAKARSFVRSFVRCQRETTFVPSLVDFRSFVRSWTFVRMAG